MNINRQKASIGVTGATTRDEAAQVLGHYHSSCKEHLPGKKEYPDLMIGTLASSKH